MIYLKSINQKFTVNFKYKTIFTKDLFSIKNNTLNQVFRNVKTKHAKKIIVILDSNVVLETKDLERKIIAYCDFYKDNINLKQKPIIVCGGESLKNKKESVNYIYNHINKNEICRQSYVIAIGGGSLLDVVGFASATAHRGVRFIRIPTTTLSQNDSGVGVKNGINYFKKKNFVGSFALPTLVINDYKFLNTLKHTDWISGLPEALKVSLIKTKKFFDFIENNTQKILNRKLYVMNKLNYICAKLHILHIGSNGDPFEVHSSRPLDFGHWAAHKLETATKNKLTHGHAVAIGIAIDCTYSFLINTLSTVNWKKIIFVLLKLRLNVHHKKLNTKENILEKGLIEFKEHLGGQLTIMLLHKVGKGITVNTMCIEKIKKAIKLLEKIQKKIINV